MTKNKFTEITAEPGKQEIFIEQEFDAHEILSLKRLSIRSFMYNGLGHVDSQ